MLSIMSQEKQLAAIVHCQSQFIVSYSNLSKISITESAKLFKKYNILEYISICYEYLHLHDVDYIVKYDIAERLKKGLYYSI